MYNRYYHYMLYILILFYLLIIVLKSSYYVYGGSMWKHFVPSAQSGYEPKILLKNKVYTFLKVSFIFIYK